MNTRRKRLIAIAAAAALTGTTLTAAPAQAASQVASGTISDSSYCVTYAATSLCFVYLTNKDKPTVTTRPVAVGEVNCPGNVADGGTIYSAIGTKANPAKALHNKYIAVLWGGTAGTSGYGTIVCH